MSFYYEYTYKLSVPYLRCILLHYIRSSCFGGGGTLQNLLYAFKKDTFLALKAHNEEENKKKPFRNSM